MVLKIFGFKALASIGKNQLLHHCLLAHRLKEFLRWLASFSAVPLRTWKGMIFLILLGSVGRNMGRKTNVYISSSAGARWREVRAPAHRLSRSGSAAGRT